MIENTQAYQAGRDARYHGSKRSDNPYDRVRDHFRHKQWNIGWDDEQVVHNKVMLRKNSRINQLQEIGLSFLEAFKLAAGELRDEEYALKNIGRI